MRTLFLTVLDMSIVGGIVILAVLLVRLCLRRAPKAFSYALWAVVLFRLLCPVSVSFELSVVPETLSGGTAVREWADTYTEDTWTIPDDSVYYDAAVTAGREPVPAGDGGHYVVAADDQLREPDTVRSAWLPGLSLVWLAGMAAMLVYSGVSLLKLRRKLAASVRLRDNIYLADHIASPFVMGLFRPKIYLPSSLPERERSYIILHEQYHIRRLDNVVRLLAFTALCVHWFNPLVWAAFVLSGKDMEMRCDEAVVRELGTEIRADYSASLLSLATGRRVIAGAPLAFGEGDTKGRIKNLLNWRQARPAVVFLAASAVLLAALLLGTDAAVSGSWIKAENSLEREQKFSCNLEEPIRAWAFYEDIYEDGVLVSSRPCLLDGFQGEGGVSERQFTVSLLMEPVYAETGDGFAGELDCAVQIGGTTATWTPILPKDHYTGMGAVTGQNDDSLTRRQKIADDGSVVLYTVLLSTEPDGGIRIPGGDAIRESNDTVVQYRLVTSTEGMEAFESTGSLNNEEAAEVSEEVRAIFEKAQEEPNNYDVTLKVLDMLCRAELWGGAIEEMPTLFWPGNFGPSARFEQAPANPDALDATMARRACVLMRLRPLDTFYVTWSYPGADGETENRMLHANEMNGIMMLSSHTRTYEPIESAEDLQFFINFLRLDSKLFVSSAGDGNSLSQERIAQAGAVWFGPEDICDVEYMELVWHDGQRFTPLTGEGYEYIEGRLSAAKKIGATACPFESAVLYIHRADGTVGKVIPAADSCDVFLSDGKYYQYGDRDEPPYYEDNSGFYAAFGTSTEELPHYTAAEPAVRPVELGAEDTFTDILGYDGYIQSDGGTIWETRTYYAVTDGGTFPIAESFGFDGIEDYSVDLDGDGVNELIANVQYGGDGHEDVYVYRRTGDGPGGIEKGLLDLSDLPNHDDWGVNSTASEYDPDENLFRIRYTQKNTEESGVLEARGLERFTFIPYVPVI